MMPQAAADDGSLVEGDQASSEQASDNSFAIQVQMQNVELNENILIDSRSQVSSFVVQADRIKALETEHLNLTVKHQKLESQLRQAEKEKERLVKEKAEQEARLRHQWQEQLKEARETAEEQMRETV